MEREGMGREREGGGRGGRERGKGKGRAIRTPPTDRTGYGPVTTLTNQCRRKFTKILSW